MPVKDAKLREICEEMRALTARIRAEPVTFNDSAARHIISLLRPGPGLLAELRPPPPPGSERKRKALTDDLGSGEHDPDVRDEDSSAGEPAQMSAEEIRFLHDLQPEIEARNEVVPVTTSINLEAQVVPLPHQRRSAAMCLHAAGTRLKGGILAQKSGQTQDLTLLLLVALGSKPRDGPSVVVMPRSRCRRFMEEITESFTTGTMPALWLKDNSVGPLQLGGYKLVVVSYEYVETGKTEVIPKRPKVTLLSGIWNLDGAKKIGRYLCLHNADAMKKHNGQAFAAIKKLRSRFEGCFVTTGTPLNNSWADLFMPANLITGGESTTRSRPSEAFANGIMEAVTIDDGGESSTLEAR
ncbi:hypothetical protein LTR97_004261 [Elasticomyces elasticus]|uniref:SNF2 N-terminal domain-containing protein n=1 Tax=Elasticomyces elasticus TaxID=574655 RepID=A0AAN7VTE9_9PEZI|nr:hypothetical protein LTR97_004261 [Elasticomyces elasticus]